MNQNYVTLRSSNGLTVMALRGKDPVRVTGGYGGWEVVDRSKRVGYTRWRGRDPFEMDVPLLFDGFANRQGQEARISTLERMAGQGGVQPPTINFAPGTRGIPHDDLTWVIKNLQWGTDTILEPGEDGVLSRLRQDVVVSLIQKVDDTLLKEVNTAPGRPGSVVFQKGDTLKKIAQRYYGDINKWRDIAKANGIRDPSKIEVGRRLKLP